VDDLYIVAAVGVQSIHQGGNNLQAADGVQLIDLTSFFSFWALDLGICGRSSQEITHEATGFAAASCHPGNG